MTTDASRTCTLDADEVSARADAIRALAPALVSATLRLRREPETLRRVEELVAAESRCCAFLDFEVEQGEEIVVRIS